MPHNVPDHCKDDVPSPQESRGRPPHLNENIVGRRSGGATTMFTGDDGSDWGESDYEDAQEGLESTQQVNDGNTNVVPPFLDEYIANVVPARLPGTYFENGPQGFRLQRIMDENFRCSSCHNAYEPVGLEQLMGDGRLDSFMAERVGSPSSMINEVHMSERTSSSSSVKTSWNSTPDQSLILAHISDKMEMMPPSDDELEWDEFDEFDDFELSNLDCRCASRCACRCPRPCCG